jgi:DNA polymerase
MGWKKFQAQLAGFGVDIDGPEATNIIAIYRRTYPAIPALWKEAQRCLDALIRKQSCALGKHSKAIYLGENIERRSETTLGFQLPNGMTLNYLDLQVDEGQYTYAARNSRTKIYGGKVIENVCQALARCIISWQMVHIARRYKVALTVHDSLVCVIQEDEVQQAQEFIEGVMRTSPKWAAGLPLDCESGVGKSYGDCS